MAKIHATRLIRLDGRELDPGELLDGRDPPLALVPGDAKVATCHGCPKRFLSVESMNIHIRKRHGGPGHEPGPPGPR